ncbi:hypothetical protein CCACVL1_04228 [Corchorus capsularis]|uniref:Uncharacterized protein n=1 Tax=Corchorus capsularis TaxID=210143 RepID=A0A1R3JU46_COCAP|nr:hypothetical protein CCACVL1_04228 [Corchorus capsularis]
MALTLVFEENCVPDFQMEEIRWSKL